ncbi:MAG: hypothetical protein AMXMBFR12_05360 [Candidatus Babeliales bacterium]
MKKLLFTFGLLFISQVSLSQQPPVIQNRTISVPASNQNIPYQVITGILGPVQGGVPPYRFNAFGPIDFPLVITHNGHFALPPVQLPVSFDYTVTDNQGLTSAPATITLMPGAILHEEIEAGTEAEPG